MFWRKAKSKDGMLILVVGATRSGKTTKVKELVKRYKNVVVVSISPVWTYREIKTLDEWKKYLGGKVRLTSLLFSKEFSPEILLWKGGYILVIDDAPTVISHIGNLQWNKILLSYRNYGITIIYISQSFTKVPKYVINNADVFIVGYLPNKAYEEKFLRELYNREITLPEVEPFTFKVLRVRK